MKKILLIAGLLIAGGLGVTLYVYNKPHQNIRKAKVDYKLEAAALFADFEENEEAANAKYLDKIIEVTGEVMEVKNENGAVNITLDAGSMMFGVICQLDELTDHPKADFQQGETVTLKGICTGMLMDVVLVRCVQI